MMIPEPIFLEGESLTHDELLHYCREQEIALDLPEWKADVFSFIQLFLDPAAGDILQKSSGTTGDPKSFILSREAMFRSARKTLDLFKLQKQERALLCLPVDYIAGKMMVVRALVGQLDLVLAEPSSRPIENLAEQVGLASMVPLQVEGSLNHSDPLEKISRLLIGGGEIHPSTQEILSWQSGTEIYESFGMSETYTHFALKRINGPDAEEAFRLLESVKVRTDSRGCLEVEVPGITQGMVLTNDLVEISENGESFTWLGRFDNVINSGGIKIIPELVEKQAAACLGYECLLLSEEDRTLGNRLVLMVEFEGEDPPLLEWLEKLRSRLSPYELPKRVLCVSKLPRNNSMKPDRTSARELLL